MERKGQVRIPLIFDSIPNKDMKYFRRKFDLPFCYFKKGGELLQFREKVENKKEEQRWKLAKTKHLLFI